MPLFIVAEPHLQFREFHQNPGETSRRSRIFLFSLLYMCIYVFIFVTSWPNEKLSRPEIWYTRSPRRHLKTGFCFFEKVTLRAESFEKLPCHVDFPHISSITLFYLYSSWFIFMTLTNTTQKCTNFPHSPHSGPVE